jgi:type IV secretion system protein VirB10
MIRLFGRTAAREENEQTVRGERGRTTVTRTRSLQSRLSNVLAAALVTTVGGALLTWYYARALAHPTARAPAIAAADAVPSRMPLPPLGPVVAPRPPAPPAQRPRAVSAAPVATGLGLPMEPPAPPTPVSPAADGAASASTSPQARALARRLSSEVFARAADNEPSMGAAGGESARVLGQPSSPMPGFVARGRSRSAPLTSLLAPRALAATRAQLLPSRRLLLPKGTFIDCTLETAIDSTLPGMTTCITSTDTFSADGSVVLLERGSQLIGETRGEVRQGQARVFVVWTEARTPDGVVVRLDSPGTDALGRSGLAGTVNRHFWQRFGAATLISLVDGAVQTEVQSSSRGGAVILDPTASEDVMNSVLSGTLDIPPTIDVPNGSRIQVLVARDVDFRSVYELEPR